MTYNVDEANFIGLFFIWLATDAVLMCGIVPSKNVNKRKLTLRVVQFIIALAFLTYTVFMVKIATTMMILTLFVIGCPYLIFSELWDNGTLNRWGDKLRDVFYDYHINMLKDPKDDDKNNKPSISIMI